MFLPLRLRAPISRFHALEPEDVIGTKARLSNLGHYEEPEYGLTIYPDDALFDAIEAFQKNNGLEVDGIMNPDGPTERTINQTLASVPNSREPEEGPNEQANKNNNRPDDDDLAFMRRGRGGQPKRKKGSDDDCERLLAVDSSICRRVKRTKGASAAEACWASASRRYSACRTGRPMPPLNTGTW